MFEMALGGTSHRHLLNACFSIWFILLLFVQPPVLVRSFSLPSPMFGYRSTPKAVSEKQEVGAISMRTSQESRLRASPEDIAQLETKGGIVRNMFQGALYNKPIVLIGCSGEGGELNRLAESLLQHLNGRTTGELVLQDLEREDEEEGGTGISPREQGGGIVPVAGVDASGSYAMQRDDLLRYIETKRVKFPDIIVLDFDDPYFSMENGKYAAQLTDHYSELVRALYEDAGLLSIYVNVHPDEGQMSTSGAERKSKLEEDVFVRYSDYELCIKGEGLDRAQQEQAWSHAEWELRRLLARALLVPAIPGDQKSSINSPFLTMGKHTFFLSLSFPDIADVEPYVEEMCSDVDAMEYRTDLLECRDSRFDLIYGQQLLRRYCRPHAKRAPGLPFRGMVIDDVMPIVYTVRTQNQAGTYPDDASGISKMFEMLHWGLRSGAEVLDVESAWDAEKTSHLLDVAEQRYASQILGSHHVVGEEVSLEKAVRLFQQCALSGRAHGAKVVLSITDEDRDRMAYDAALITSSLAKKHGEPVIPNISMILGDVGKYSRVLNFPFTPVTHESLPFKAAPGQLTASEIMTVRLLTKLFQSKRYAILGHNIAYSVSPQMHGEAFFATKLPHEYVRADVPTVEEFVDSDFFKADDFGGCSVTIPHKQSIIPFVDEMSDAAKAIGSVNTVIVKEEIGHDEIKRIVHGDNTDWKGIYYPLERKLGGKSADKRRDCALIIGAGGTARAAAYAAEKLGLERIYYNRTPSKAVALADAFGGTVASNLDPANGDGKSLGDIVAEKNGVIRVVISTLPSGAEFVLPEWMVSTDKGAKPIVFDVNYKPYNTKLLLQAESAGCELVRGSEMLWEQGVGQFEAWTERTAPYKVMKGVVLENCIPKKLD